MEKLRNQFKIPRRSSSDTADLQTQTQNLCLKRVPKEDPD